MGKTPPAVRVFKSAQAAKTVLDQYRHYLDTWPVPNQQHFIPTRQGDTFVVACGAEDAPPVVLLHGTMSNTASWLREIVAWANRFRVYAVDIIGDAGFSAPTRPPFNSDAHAQWLMDILDALELDNCSFVGTSMGGGIALDFAIRHPQRVTNLVLQCPSGVANKNILWWALPLLLLGPWGARKVREIIIGKYTEAETNSIEAKQFADFTDTIFKGMRPRTEKPHSFNNEQLSGLSMPVLVLLGGRDVTMNSHLIKQRFEQHVSNAKVVVFPQLSHYLGDQSAAIAGFLS